MTTESATSAPRRVEVALAQGVLPRKFLRPLLLVALSRNEISYGYQLAETLRTFGLAIDMAGVYRELRAMEQHDMLDSSWVPSDAGPDRRVYRLTSEGKADALAAAAQLELARDMLSAVLDDSRPVGR